MTTQDTGDIKSNLDPRCPVQKMEEEHVTFFFVRDVFSHRPGAHAFLSSS